MSDNRLLQSVFNNPLYIQVLRFGVIGLSAAAIHFLIVVYLVQVHAFAPLIANVFAFGVSFQISYWGHRTWTFSNSDVLHRIAIPKLLFIQILNFVCNELLFYLLLSLHLPYTIALLIVLAVLPIFTFITSKVWIFRSV